MSDNVRFDITARDEATAKLRLLTAELRELQNVLASNQIAASRFGIDATQRTESLRRSITVLRESVGGLESQLGQAFSKVPQLGIPTGVTASWDRYLDAARKVTVAHDSSITAGQRWLASEETARQRAIQLGERQATTEIASARKVAQQENEFALQRRLNFAANIDAAKQLKIAQEWRAADIDARKGFQEADREIASRAKLAGQERLYGLERRLDVAFQLDAAARVQSAHARTAAGISNITNNTARAGQELKHVVAGVDELASGRHGQFVSTLGAALRDSGVGFSGIVTGLGALVGAGILVHIVEQYAHWNTELATLAQRQSAFAAATGQSAREFAVFSTMMKLSGGNAETAARAIESLQKRMEDAIRSPKGNIADVFANPRFSLTLEELRKLIAMPGGIDQVIRRLAEAFVQMGDSAQRTALFTQLLGGPRYFSEMVKLLEGGAAGYDKQRAAAQRASQAFQVNLEQLKVSAERLDQLSVAFENFKAAVVGGEGMFGNIITGLTTLLQELSGVQQFDWSRIVPIPAFQELRSMGIVGPWRMGARDTIERPEGPSPRPGRVFPYRGSSNFGIGGASSAALEKQLRDTQTPEQRWLSDIAPFPTVTNNLRSTDPIKWATDAQARDALSRFDPNNLRANPLWGPIGDGGTSGRAPQLRRGMPSLAQPADVNLDLDVRAQGGPIPRPEDFSLEASERAYKARLDTQKLIAQEKHDRATVDGLAQKEAELTAMSVTERRNFLAEQISGKNAQGDLVALGKAEADQIVEIEHSKQNIARVTKETALDAQATALAELRQREAVARGKEDYAAIPQFRQREKDIISSSVYSDHAQRIEAETKQLQAQIELRKHNFQIEEQTAAMLRQTNQDVLHGFEAQQQSRVRQGGGYTQQQAYSEDIKMVRQLGAEDAKRLDALMKQEDAIAGIAESGKGNVTQARLWREEWALGVSLQAKQLELTEKIDEANKKVRDAWTAPLKQGLDKIGTGFESALTGLLDRTKTFQQAWAEIGKSVTSAGIGIVGGTLSKVAAGFVPGSKSGEGLGEALSNYLTKQISELILHTGLLGTIAGNTAVSATANTASTGSSALSSAGSLGGLASGVKALSSGGSGGGIGGFFSGIGEFLGLSGPAAAGAEVGSDIGLQVASTVAEAAIAKGGWVVPSYAKGGMSLPTGTHPALLHAREMVLPAGISEGMQNLIKTGANSGGDAAVNDNSSGTLNLHFNGPSDGPSVQRWFTNLMSRNPDVVRDMLRGPLGPRALSN